MEVIVDKRREANTQLFSSSTAHLVQKLQLVQKNYIFGKKKPFSFDGRLYGCDQKIDALYDYN